MSLDGYQVVVFCSTDRVPFVLPQKYRWQPSMPYVRNGKTRLCQVVKVPTKEAATEIVALCKENGLHGVIQPRFKVTNTPQLAQPPRLRPKTAQSGARWLLAYDPWEKTLKRRLRRKRARLRAKRSPG